jgi:hypothetical protein
VQTDLESTGIAANPKLETKWWTPALAGPVIAAAVVRLALLAVSIVRTGSSVFSGADTASYLMPGRNLLLHGSFVADGVPDLLRTPGYSLFLAITSLTGLTTAAAVNIILSVFSVLLVWKLGRTVFQDDRIALGAAWIFAFEPISIVNSFVLMSDTLFLALLLLSLERLAMFLRCRRLPVLAAAGLWLAAAALARPVAYYLAVPLALGLFLLLVRVPDLRWKAPAVLLISVLPWLAAWQIRNRVETGYREFSSISDLNLYFFCAADVTARLEHKNWLDVRNELGYTVFTDHAGQSYLYPAYLATHPEQTGWSQTQRLTFMHTEAVHIIRAHLGTYLHLCFESLLKAVFNPGAGFFDHLLDPQDQAAANGLIDKGPVRWGITLALTHPWAALEKVAFEVVLLGFYLFALRGVFRAGMYNPCIWLLLGTSVYFLAVTAAAGGAGADARFRLPIMPVVCILAAAGIWRAKAIAR